MNKTPNHTDEQKNQMQKVCDMGEKVTSNRKGLDSPHFT